MRKSPHILAPALMITAVLAAVVSAAFELYPGAKKPDWAEKLRHSAALEGIQTDAGARDVEIYSTPDAFEKVYAFYKKLGTEVRGMSSEKGRPGPRGITVHVGAFTLDGAPTLRESRQCVVITRPVFLDVKLQEMRDETAIEVLTKK